MRVFLLWADKARELEHLVGALNRAPHTLVYWLGQEGMEGAAPPGVIFHAHSDAANGIAAKGVDTSDFAPPGEEIISAFYKVESIILTMMNRSFDHWCVDERRHFYYQLLAYWLGVFKKYRPDVLIFPVEPHGPYDYLAYELAKHFSIRTICFNETRASDRLLYMSDFREGSSVLTSELEKQKGRVVTADELSPDLRTYYLKRTAAERGKTPAYVSFLQNKYSASHRFSLSKILQSIREGTIVRKVYSVFFVEKNFSIFSSGLRAFLNIVRPNLRKEYRLLQRVPDLKKKFIYAALQVQPERSTSPMGDMFVDQILAIEILAASLPDDWVVYVKEHPLQWVRIGLEYSSSRYRGYYKKIAQIRKVQLIPPETNSYELIDAAQTVMTVAGAPGWEAILHGKPSIIFGNPWYTQCPGTFRVSSVENTTRAIKRISDDFSVDQGRVLNFLKCVDDSSIHGFLADSNSKNSELSRQENMESIAALILKELQSS